jgi:lipoate-protein ligase A
MFEIWDFVQSPAGSAAFNMALDEALLLTAAKRGRPLLRVYSWQGPSVSIGYFQKFPVALAGRYAVVRRPTGGGLVYHGESVDTTYTVIVPPDHSLYAMSTAQSYRAIHKAVALALELVGCVTPRDVAVASDAPAEVSGPTKTRSYECFQRPVAGDVVFDGRKLAGGAQRRNKLGMLHQGSIAVRISSVALRRAFCEVFEASVYDYKFSDAERTQAEELARKKYATDAWNRR